MSINPSSVLIDKIIYLLETYPHKWSTAYDPLRNIRFRLMFDGEVDNCASIWFINKRYLFSYYTHPYDFDLDDFSNRDRKRLHLAVLKNLPFVHRQYYLRRSVKRIEQVIAKIDCLNSGYKK